MAIAPIALEPMVLPPIIRRVHPRATRLKLRIAGGQVFLTIPPRAKPDEIARFLQHSQAWLQQHSALFTEQPIHTTSCADDFLTSPNSLSVSILNNHYSLKISESASSVVVNKENVIFLPKNQPAKYLTAWILSQSKQTLPKRLEQLAKQYGFIYQGCSVRHAKTRWGSCNHRGKISLNAGLALLDAEIADYVMLHELCHTRHMNHSAQFWTEVQRVCPDYQAQRIALRQFRWPVWWVY